ncbi:hypothetical protein [Pandoraea pnomenusa]|nr:hypothetical protein [Pandoraea pnomenusa]AHN77602.1 hypothetical protein DA70_21720 [Pandoraea pnomenusa]MBN9094397.1 hypothetical protein [Pandoraea pnomenusa]QDH61035.1 hypothetical protein FKQ53_18370 [Pandoraea pnomenusa]
MATNHAFSDEDFTMMHGIQPAIHAPGTGGLTSLSPLAPTESVFRAGGVAGTALAHVANARVAASYHPWSVDRASARSMPVVANHAMRPDFQAVSSGGDVGVVTAGSVESMQSMESAEADPTHGGDSLLMAPRTGAPRVAQPVLCPSALAALHVCASLPSPNARGASIDGRQHPVVMPDGRSERAQLCRDIVAGALLGTEGRNGTVPFEPTRETVTRTVADTARRWTGKPSLAGKKEWTQACMTFEAPGGFIGRLNDRLHSGARVLPDAQSTEWMLRVGFADSLPMHQALVRGDLPPSVGMGTDEWARLALGVEHLGARHWEMRHTEVMDAAVLPATNTKAFTALATSMSTLPAHIATQRLRNKLSMYGVPTAPAPGTSTAPSVG